MSGIRNLLNIAKSALMTSQANVNVASHNLANVNTEGYSKQEAMMYAKPGIKTTKGVIGDGVDISYVRRREAIYAERRLYDENSRLSHWTTRRQLMDQIEALFSGIGESDLNANVTKFFNAWEDLSGNSTDMVFRAQVLEQAKALTDKFHYLHTEINQIRENVNTEISGKVRQVNEILHKVKLLNKKIARVGYDGIKANDLMDSRGKLVRNLSELLEIDLQDRPHGKISISYNGNLLLSDDEVYELSSDKVTKDGVLSTDIFIGGQEVEVNNGDIGGLFAIQNNMLDSYENTLNDLAAGIVSNVNSTHEMGFDLYGNLGTEFFDPGKQTAGSIRVNKEIAKDYKKIAAAGGTHDWVGNIHVSNGVGDNSVALRMADLRYLQIMDGNSSTFEDVYNELYADVGFDASDAQQSESDHQLLVDQLDNYRESIVGVSSDEELADIMEFQNAYASAAKLITVADEMMATLINMVG